MKYLFFATIAFLAVALFLMLIFINPTNNMMENIIYELFALAFGFEAFHQVVNSEFPTLNK